MDPIGTIVWLPKPKKQKRKRKNPVAQKLTAMRNRKLTPERRAEIAKKAAEARWRKRNQE
jgi:hypothetical protein